MDYDVPRQRQKRKDNVMLYVSSNDNRAVDNPLRNNNGDSGSLIRTMAKEYLLNGQVVPKSTIPDEWLQPLVAEKVVELRKVEDDTEALLRIANKRIGELQFKLDIARVALKWIVDCKPVIDCGYADIMERARIALKKIYLDVFLLTVLLTL